MLVVVCLDRQAGKEEKKKKFMAVDDVDSADLPSFVRDVSFKSLLIDFASHVRALQSLIKMNFSVFLIYTGSKS